MFNNQSKLTSFYKNTIYTAESVELIFEVTLIMRTQWIAIFALGIIIIEGMSILDL